jgi:hypothetical protein
MVNDMVYTLLAMLLFWSNSRIFIQIALLLMHELCQSSKIPGPNWLFVHRYLIYNINIFLLKSREKGRRHCGMTLFGRELPIFVTPVQGVAAPADRHVRARNYLYAVVNH